MDEIQLALLTSVTSLTALYAYISEERDQSENNSTDEEIEENICSDEEINEVFEETVENEEIDKKVSENEEHAQKETEKPPTKRKRVLSKQVHRRWWVRPTLCRNDEEDNLLQDNILKRLADDTIKNMLHMTETDFEYLLSLVGPKIRRYNTYMRKAVSPRTRLIITLRYLATGESYYGLECLFRVSKALISKIVSEVCEHLSDVLKDYMQLPSNKEEWLKISGEFERKFDFPHAIGVIDGKHIRIRTKKATGSSYFNHKHFFSIVLMGIVDANGNFLYVNVDGKGGHAADDILCNSDIYPKLENNLLNLPDPSVLRIPYSIEVPYMLLGTKAFSFTDYCIKPFGRHQDLCLPETLFNERLLCAQGTFETAFRKLSNTFKILHSTMQIEPNVIKNVLKSTVYLYNFMHKRNPRSDNSSNAGNQASQMDKTVLPELASLQTLPKRPPKRLMDIRMHLANDFFWNRQQSAD